MEESLMITQKHLMEDIQSILKLHFPVIIATNSMGIEAGHVRHLENGGWVAVPDANKVIKSMNHLGLELKLLCAFVYYFGSYPALIQSWKELKRLQRKFTKKSFVQVTCDAVTVANGFVSYNHQAVRYDGFGWKYGKYRVDTKASIWCDAGFRNTGDSTMTCQITGEWRKQSTPKCTLGKFIYMSYVYINA